MGKWTCEDFWRTLNLLNLLNNQRLYCFWHFLAFALKLLPEWLEPDAPHVHEAPSLSRSPGRCCGQTQQRSDFSLNQLEIDNTSDSTRIDGGIFTAWWPFDVLIHMLGQSCISLVSCMVGATKDQLLNALIKAMAWQEAIGWVQTISLASVHSCPLVLLRSMQSQNCKMIPSNDVMM